MRMKFLNADTSYSCYLMADKEVLEEIGDRDLGVMNVFRYTSHKSHIPRLQRFKHRVLRRD